VKTSNQLRNELRDFINLILDQIKTLPIYTNAKDRLMELADLELPAHFWEVYNEVYITVVESLPTPELRDIAELIFKYVEKRLKREPVDDAAEIAAISKKLTVVIESLIKEIKNALGLDALDTKSVPFLGINIPVSLVKTC